MTLQSFIDALMLIVQFISNAVILAVAVSAYQEIRRRSLLLIAIMAGLGVALVLVAMLMRTASSNEVLNVLWYLECAMWLTSMSVWLFGCRMLIRDYCRLVKRIAQPDAAPEPPSAGAVRESSETMNPKPESEAPADSGGR